MNDRLIIHDRRYLINDISTTLNNGEVKMNLLRELITFDFECNCVRVSFTYEGVDYSFDVPKDGEDNGKNYYKIEDIAPFNKIEIFWDSEKWLVIIPTGESAGYSNTTDNECPFFDDWDYYGGDLTVTNLTTTPCE